MSQEGMWQKSKKYWGYRFLKEGHGGLYEKENIFAKLIWISAWSDYRVFYNNNNFIDMGGRILFAAIFVIVWIIQYTIVRHTIKKMNENLHRGVGEGDFTYFLYILLYAVEHIISK